MNTMNKNNLLEIIIFSIFCISVIALSCFHEPWFDELQAWGISKDSIYNILFVIPHYEGHPPIWHLLLKPFSWMNLFPDTGLKIVNLAFMLPAVWMLIFKSKLPAPVRYLLPFTYFIFYQYSIVNRPYCIYCLALFLIAAFYNSKNEHPFKFVSFLALLSLSCLYGLAVACGFSIVWIIELIKSKTPWNNKSYISLLILFIFACIITVLIMPDKNNYVFNDIYVRDNIVKGLYSLFVLPADALFFDVYNWGAKLLNIDFAYFINASDNPKLYYIKILFFTGCFLGLIINIFLICLFKHLKSLLMFIIPYFSFLIIGFFYISPHHIGLLTILLISVFWIVLSAKKCENPNYKKLLTLFTVLVISIQIYWSISAGILEVKYNYFPAKAEYNYLKQFNLENYKIMSAWLSSDPTFVHKKTRKVYMGNKIKTYNDFINISQNYELKVKNEINLQWPAVCIGQYFNKNIFYNFNSDNKKMYIIHTYLSPQEKAKIIAQWNKMGLPDIIVGRPNIDNIFYDVNSPSQKYVLLKLFNYGMIWKDKYYPIDEEIYILKGLKI